MAVYLGEMFPPLVVIPAMAASFLAIWWTTQAVTRGGPLVVTWQGLVAAASLTLFTLLLRIYDELKDLETDLRLGRAGDPRYRDRAVVMGRVLPADIRALRWWATGILVVLNLMLLDPVAYAAFAVAFALTYASFHWFFWPAVSRHLLLAFVTHNPLSIVLSGYVTFVYLGVFDVERLPIGSVWVAVAIWLQAAAWETARKVRIPSDETDYQTYSKVLGYRVAALLPGAFTMASALCFWQVAAAARLPTWFSVAVGAAAGVNLLGSLRAVVVTSRSAANLRPLAEMFALVVSVGLVVALAVTHGVVWSDAR